MLSVKDASQFVRPCSLAAAILLSAQMSEAQPCVDAPLFSGHACFYNPLVPGVPGAVTFSPASRAVADFDEDGYLDIIFGCDYGRLLTYFGTPDWRTFEPPVMTALPFATLTNPSATKFGEVAAADLNHDGRLDLLLGNEQTSGSPAIQRLHTMLGNGNGTFQSPVPCGPNIVTPIEVGIADFNGDTHLDMLWGIRRTFAVVLWGVGDGTFPTWTQIECGPYTDQVDVADIDQDGDIDAWVVCTQAPPVILRNNGNGTFTVEPPSFDSVGGFGNLNGDAYPDMVFSTFGGPGENWLVVMLNDGTGNYPTQAAYPVSTGQVATGSGPLLADLDGDGLDDVVLERMVDSSPIHARDQIAVWHNTGSVLSGPTLYHHPGANFGVLLTAADFSRDGAPEVMASNSITTTLLLNDGAGAFVTHHGVPMGPGAPTTSTTVDFKLLTSSDVNADGRFDLVAVRDDNPSYRECVVMLQDAAGQFTTVVATAFPEYYISGLVLADFNRDSKPDVVVSRQFGCTGEDRVRLALGNGDGSFGPWTLYHTVGWSPAHLATGDLNGDQWPDLVVATRCGAQGASVFFNNGDGSLASPVQLNLGMGTDFVEIADVNGDNSLDLAVTLGGNGSAGVRVLINNGAGTFTPAPQLYPFPPTSPDLVRFADVNDDGALDMLVVLNHSPSEPASGGVAVGLNDGDGLFTFAGVVNPGTEFYDVQVADLNDDGNLDIARSYPGNGYATGVVAINLGNGDGTFGEMIMYGGGGRALIIHDFDGDGRPDIGSPMGCSPDWDQATHAGFSILYNRTCPACYPDCNQSNTLTIADFGCFQAKFASGDPYADCNQSNSLTIADFGCFQSKFATGCP